MIELLPERVNGNAALLRRGRYVSLDFLVGVGDTDYVVSVHKGRIESIEARRLPTHSGKFAIRAAADVWEAHWQPMPRRGRHDLFSMVADGVAEFDGDLLSLMQNLQYFKDVLASPRPAKGEA